jgi:hypothetical protein
MELLKILLYMAGLLLLFYSIPLALLLMWNREVPKSREAVAVEPKAAKQQARNA